MSITYHIVTSTDGSRCRTNFTCVDSSYGKGMLPHTFVENRLYRAENIIWFPGGGGVSSAITSTAALSSRTIGM